MINYQAKYINKLKGTGRSRSPSKRKYADEIDHDKYYGYLKHRAQARHRKESYELTVEEWFDLWQGPQWFNRGRYSEAVCLVRLDLNLPWHKDNVEVVNRKQWLQQTKAGVIGR